MRWLVRAAVGVVAVMCALVLPVRPAAAACAEPTGAHTGATPWAQQLLGADQAWPLTTGKGVVVAVLGTGVDVDNPQFTRDQVRAGDDVAKPRQPTTEDCDGRGTFAAGLIAAKPGESTTFAGVAPDATILSIRYTASQEGGGNEVPPAQLAAAIRAAVRGGADVICVVAPAAGSSGALRSALRQARQADVVVVSPATASSGAVSYPTVDDSVLAVGAVAEDGKVVSTESGDHLDLAAPGDDLVSTAANGRGEMAHVSVSDPAFAAAYAAGTAALVRAYRPKLSADAVLNRLRRTASRVPGDGRDPQVGWGVINPYAAVTAEGIDSTAAPDRRALPTAIAAATPASDLDGRARLSVGIAAGGLGLAGLLCLGVHVYRRGRGRRWVPSRRSLAEYDRISDRA
ncbi:MAG: S8 family serine peptidase [Micromonosporaceae bacterium]